MSRRPFILVTGFLGSGKTTLLKRFLNRYADEMRIAVIQNEFAPANVDGRELKETGKSFQILEINKGSVFCVCLLSSFVQSLVDLLDAHQPALVILEATGLADPIAIGQLLTGSELKDRLYLAHAWCIVDVTSFLEMEAQVQRMRHQVRIADTIILNKTDLVSADRISQTSERISRLNPWAEQVETRHCNLPPDLLDPALRPAVNAPGDRQQPMQMLPDNVVSEGAPDISSAVLRSTTPISRQALETFLHEFESASYRVKGTVNLQDRTTVSVQSCFGRTEIRPIDKEPGPTELIALGPEIDQQVFSARFSELAG